MDVVDLIIVLIVAFGGWNGYRTGLVRQVTRLFGVIIAYLLALWLRPYVVPVMGPLLQNLNWAPPKHSPFHYLLGDLTGMVSFAVVFIVCFILLRFAAGLVDALFHLPVLSTLNRVAGLAAGLILSIVFVYVAVLVAQYINAPGLQSQLRQSTVVQWMNVHQTLKNS